MFSSNAQAEFKCLLKTFSTAKRAEMDTWAFSAGYMESLAVDMFKYMNRGDQKAFHRQIERELNKSKELA